MEEFMKELRKQAEESGITMKEMAGESLVSVFFVYMAWRSVRRGKHGSAAIYAGALTRLHVTYEHRKTRRLLEKQRPTIQVVGGPGGSASHQVFGGGAGGIGGMS